SYQASMEQALMNAGKMMKEGGFESVKLEGGKEIAEVIHRLVRMGIPVMAHVGLMPQRMHTMGGFKVQGRNAMDAESVLEDAIAVVDAGAFAVVIEGVPAPLAERITRAVDVPTIGIGAGAECDGQILVSYDLLGLNDTLKPRFVKRYEQFFRRGVDAVKTYVEEVRDGAFPDVEHSFGLGEGRTPRMFSHYPTLEAMTLESPQDITDTSDTHVAIELSRVYGPTQ
ncbi:MAG: 3-methyl-2-oxobutanoate hydroxymethyltransferase, partial [Polyangiales bacterium]